MVDITPPHPDEHFGGEPAVEDTAPPRFSDEQQLGCVPQTTLMPYAAVDSSLRAMAGQAEGFGRHAIGGLHGDVYHVTTLNGTHAERCIIKDDGPGSLRDGCRRQEPLWIVFDVSGTIRLASGLRVSSHKTVDGRGRRVTLSGKGLLLRECEHVILCNLEVEGGRGHDADAVQIKPGSRHVWVDRCSLRDFADGLLDVTCGSTDVTVSRCRFSAHDKAVLIGASSGHVGDRRIRVTIHHCLFDGTRQRQPRVRFGRVHLYNNYTRGWGIYAVCASVESQIVSQCNIYEAGEKKKVFTYMSEQAADRDCSSSGRIRSEGDLFLNGAQEYTENDLETAEDDQWDFEVRDCYKPWSVQPASMALKELLESCTGWQPVPLPEDVCFTRAPAAAAAATTSV
ncbi:probable pectate lyase 4 isoform X1 [Triticum urartu]|uniref:probable pectate lyase 4 isoform X1 n=1 Tax=Triticum urartu TaxID=4572 RepID=UPI002044C33D|nr:probable pectate lyase 4 isoform X1 [Triticum urartu]